MHPVIKIVNNHQAIVYAIPLTLVFDGKALNGSLELKASALLLNGSVINTTN